MDKFVPGHPLLRRLAHFATLRNTLQDIVGDSVSTMPSVSPQRSCPICKAFKARWDTHFRCRKCRESEGRFCAPQTTCSKCELWGVDKWDRWEAANERRARLRPRRVVLSPPRPVPVVPQVPHVPHAPVVPIASKRLSIEDGELPSSLLEGSLQTLEATEEDLLAELSEIDNLLGLSDPAERTVSIDNGHVTDEAETLPVSQVSSSLLTDKLQENVSPGSTYDPRMLNNAFMRSDNPPPEHSRDVENSAVARSPKHSRSTHRTDRADRASRSRSRSPQTSTRRVISLNLSEDSDESLPLISQKRHRASSVESDTDKHRSRKERKHRKKRRHGSPPSLPTTPDVLRRQKDKPSRVKNSVVHTVQEQPHVGDVVLPLRTSSRDSHRKETSRYTPLSQHLPNATCTRQDF